MQSYKDVCGSEKMVWFDVRPQECKKFLKWAKSLGCAWMSGKEIKLEHKERFFHACMYNDGKICFVPLFAWFSNQAVDVPKYSFREYKNGIIRRLDVSLRHLK